LEIGIRERSFRDSLARSPLQVERSKLIETVCEEAIRKNVDNQKTQSNQ